GAVKCGDAADVMTGTVAEQPPGTFARMVARVGLRVENMVHIVVERPDVMRVIFVQGEGHRYERLGQLFSYNGYDIHICCRIDSIGAKNSGLFPFPQVSRRLLWRKRRPPPVLPGGKGLSFLS